MCLTLRTPNLDLWFSTGVTALPPLPTLETVLTVTTGEKKECFCHRVG